MLHLNVRKFYAPGFSNKYFALTWKITYIIITLFMHIAKATQVSPYQREWDRIIKEPDELHRLETVEVLSNVAWNALRENAAVMVAAEPVAKNPAPLPRSGLLLSALITCVPQE